MPKIQQGKNINLKKTEEFLIGSKITSPVAIFALCDNLNIMNKCDAELKQFPIW